MALPLTELNSLFVALGFAELPPTLLGNAQIPGLDASAAETTTLDARQLMRLLASPSLGEWLDYTFNKHNNTYNIRTIKCALALARPTAADERAVCLEDVRMMRVAFASYEAECSGIDKNEDALQRVLRAAGKALAKRQAKEWLAGVRESVPGRLQLYEVLEVLPLCERRDASSLAVAEPEKLKKDKAGLYLLAPAEFLESPEMKLLGRLDESFERSEEERKKREAEKARRRAAEAAARQGDATAARKDTTAPITEKLRRFDQLKDDIREANAHMAAARNATSATPGTAAAATLAGSMAPQQQRAKSPAAGQPGHRHRGSHGGSQSAAMAAAAAAMLGGPAGGVGSMLPPEDRAVWADASRTPQTRDVAVEEAAFAPPRAFPAAPTTSQK